MPLENGDNVLFWNGDDIELRPYNAADYAIADYLLIAKNLGKLRERVGADPLILDIGAGICTQAFALRDAGLAWPIYNLDLFSNALEIGAKVAQALAVKDIHFGQVNVLGALTNDQNRSVLTSTIKGLAGTRPIVVISRFAIHPFFSIREYQNLFLWLLNEVGVAGGAHLEMCGYHTKAYRRLCQKVGVPLKLANKTVNEAGDPLHFLLSVPGVETIERQELWPHYLSTMFPSYAAWSRQ